MPCGRRRLAVGQDPEVRGDAGVVEELVGQRDDAFQQSFSRIQLRISDSPEPAAPVNSGRAVEDDGQPRAAALSSTGFIFEIMCCRNSNEPSLIRGSPAPNRPA